MNLLDRIAYDSGGYTVQEILSSFSKKILEIIDLVNKNEELCDDARTLIENIRNEVVPDLVNDIMKELQDNGYFDSLVNVTLIEQLRTELTTLLNQTITDYTKRLDNFDTQLNNILQLKKINSDLYSKFQHKLRKGESVSIACIGDSMTYGSDFNSDNKLQPTGTTDNGVSHVATRSPIQYPSAMGEFLNTIYNNKITIKNMGYSGDGTKKGYEHWNASGCDLAILSYGINDSSNVNISYVGNVEEYLKWYRKIIERELLNGTACIILSPTKQLLVSRNDEDSRTSVDVFASATKMLAHEYNIPWLDGHIMLEGYGAKNYSDSTHLNSVGYKILGTRMGSIFIGEGADKQYDITGYDFLGANPLLDNFKLINGALLVNNSLYPTPSETFQDVGNAILLKDGQSVIYSFYCKQSNTIVIPNLYTSSESCDVKIILDNGIEQADYQNYFTSTKNLVVDWENNERSVVNVTKNDLIDYSKKCYTGKNFMYSHQPYILITSRGWHTIKIQTNFGNDTDSCTFYGIEFMDFNTFNDKITTVKDLTLYNCLPYDEERKPIIKIKNNGIVYLEGAIKNITDISGRLLSFDAKYAPQTNQTFVVALSSSADGGIGTINVSPSGNIILNYKSKELADFTTLFNISWNIKNN